jgi:hypothetical protein
VTAITLVVMLHAGVTLAMTGLIWFVQIVHYPLMQQVPSEAFVNYELQHTRRTGWVVGPLMLIELGTAIALVVSTSEAVDVRLAWTGLALLAVVWLSTVFLQVPCHRRLERGFDAAVARRLVRTNWIRTVGWSARGVIGLLLFRGQAA